MTTPDPMAIYDRLYDRYGDLDWWPADGPFEVMVGAVLTQRTAWSNVERALERLRAAGIRGPKELLGLDRVTLEDHIRPSGTYRQKAGRLVALFRLVTSGGRDDVARFLDRTGEEVRSDLLTVNGIGPETADSIVLYAAERPIFVVDAYTRRVLARLGIDAGTSYDDVARWFMDQLPEDLQLFKNFHAVLVELAKEHCRTRPLCDGCALADMCPSFRR